MFEAPACWTKRLALNGHTGWSDPVIYAYDQLERLALLRSVLPKAAHAESFGAAFPAKAISPLKFICCRKAA